MKNNYKSQVFLQKTGNNLIKKDGALLDSKNLAIIDRMAGEHDFQIWLESVDETGEIGIVIEAGEVKKNNYPIISAEESASVLD